MTRSKHNEILRRKQYAWWFGIIERRSR